MTKRRNFFQQLFLSLDQLLNVLALGYHDTTISARTGYFARGTGKKRWLNLERFINWGFEPIDGPDHCIKAYLSDKHEFFYEPGALGTIHLWLVVLIFVPLIWLVLTIYTKITGFKPR
jgi:hypothetical protein